MEVKVFNKICLFEGLTSIFLIVIQTWISLIVADAILAIGYDEHVDLLYLYLSSSSCHTAFFKCIERLKQNGI